MYCACGSNVGSLKFGISWSLAALWMVNLGPVQQTQPWRATPYYNLFQTAGSLGSFSKNVLDKIYAGQRNGRSNRPPGSRCSILFCSISGCFDLLSAYVRAETLQQTPYLIARCKHLQTSANKKQLTTITFNSSAIHVLEVHHGW